MVFTLERGRIPHLGNDYVEDAVDCELRQQTTIMMGEKVWQAGV